MKRRKSCSRRSLGPMRFPAHIDVVAALREIGVEVNIETDFKEIPIGIVKVEPMKQPTSEILYMQCRYGRTKP